MEQIWSVLCRSTSLDDLTNQLSLFEVAEGIKIEASSDRTEDEKIVIPIKLTLATSWWRSNPEVEETGYQKVSMMSPDNESIGVESSEIEINLTGGNQRFRVRNSFINIPYAGSGIYNFVVQHRNTTEDEWEKVDSIPFEITLTIRDQLQD